MLDLQDEWLVRYVYNSDVADYSAEVPYMCRNIKTLFNFAPPVTAEEIHAAAIQFVRKVSGFTIPTKVNEAAFFDAVAAIAAATSTLLSSLETKAPSRNRAEAAAKARARSAQRFSQNQLPHQALDGSNT